MSTWLVTFFVDEAQRTADGWEVSGDAGTAPPQPADTLTFVHHEDTSEEDEVDLFVVEASDDRLRLVGGLDVRIRRGDILGAEIDR